MKKSLLLLLFAVFFSGCHPSEAYLKSRVVKLQSIRGSCSGEQVRAPSGVDYILTASHCKVLEVDGSIDTVTEDGRVLSRRIIAEDPNSDLMLLEGLPNLQGIDMASASFPGEHIKTYTHGRGLDTYKTEGFIIQRRKIQIDLFIIDHDEKNEEDCKMPKHRIYEGGGFFGVFEICSMVVEEEFITAMVVPGSSGGLVVDNGGYLVGIVSAGSGEFGLIVPLKEIRSFLNNY